jgi:hypothetical protein
MEPLELKAKLQEEGKVRYAGKKGPGMTGDYAADPSWPYNGAALGTLSNFINSGRFTYEQVRDALWKQLDRFDGNAYGAYVRSHDGGQSLVYFLLGKGEDVLLNPIPPDTRFAPLDDATQNEFLSKSLDLYGNPMVDFHRNEGAAKWAAFASNPPYNAFDVKPETARWLLLNNLISGGNDRGVWAKFSQKTIAEACYIIESEFNHPGVV